jgi:hypothetical protein
MELNIPATKERLDKIKVDAIKAKVDAKLKLTPEELSEWARVGDVRDILKSLLLYVYK